jgi:hypothetical protein
LAALELLEPSFRDFTNRWVVEAAVVARDEAMEHDFSMGWPTITKLARVG